MLVTPSTQREIAKAPTSILGFRDSVSQGLGNGWNVQLTAYDDDEAELEGISAELLATSGSLVVTITHHAGFDTVLVGLSGNAPTIPIEDLAVACNKLDKQELLALADQDPIEAQPILHLKDAIHFLKDSRQSLQVNLKNERFHAKLNSIAAEFATRLASPSKS